MKQLFENILESFEDIFQPFKGEEKLKNQLDSIKVHTLYRPSQFHRAFLDLNKSGLTEFATIRIPKEFNKFFLENPYAKEMDSYGERNQRDVGYEVGGIPVIRHWTTHTLDQDYESIFTRTEDGEKILNQLKNYILGENLLEGKNNV